MRKLPTAVVLSAALHTAAIAWVGTRAPKPEAVREVTPALTVTVVDPPPLVVALLDDHSVSALPGSLPAAATRASPPVRTGRAQQPALSTGHAQVPETRDPHDAHPPDHSTLMTMRHPEIQRGVSTDFVQRFLEHGQPPAPRDTRAEQQEDDIAASEGRLHESRWVTNATPDQLTAERVRLLERRGEHAARELKPEGRGTKAEHTTFTAHVEPDGTAHFQDERNLKLHGLGASFDVTDWAMRSHGQDPYASAKLKMLDDTRDERAAIGSRYKRAQLAQSPQLMAGNLARLRARARDVAALKAGVFALWDDCAETGSDELVAGGTAARRYVVGFIRTQLPAGGADAFTSAELAQLNAHRQSKATFAPYD